MRQRSVKTDKVIWYTSLKEGKRKLNIDQLKTEKGERHRAIKNWKMNMKEIN